MYGQKVICQNNSAHNIGAVAQLLSKRYSSQFLQPVFHFQHALKYCSVFVLWRCLNQQAVKNQKQRPVAVFFNAITAVFSFCYR